MDESGEHYTKGNEANGRTNIAWSHLCEESEIV